MAPPPSDPPEFHPPVEEYLEAIHTLAEEGTEVIQARIAERIGRSAPSVSEMLGRLEDDGYIERHGRRLTLTPEGEAIAHRVVRKHRLAERLLVDVIGLEWHKAHMEAGRWEHVISDEVEARLVTLLGNPSTCPHGNPIPGGPDQDARTVVRLSDVTPGAMVKLVRVTEEVEIDTAALSHLGEHGFITGAVAEVVSRSPGGQVVLQVGDGPVELSPKLSPSLYVTVETPAVPAA